MKPVCFSFILNASPLRSMKSDVFENDYQTVYKPLIKFIYKHSNVRMSFFFNGPQFQFLKKKHPEFGMLFYGRNSLNFQIISSYLPTVASKQPKRRCRPK